MHQRWLLYLLFLCGHCFAFVSSKTGIMQQTMQVVLIKALNSGEKWTCTECDYKHKRRGYLLNHIEREHMTEDFPGYGCLRCQQVRQLELSSQT